eukprot:6212539-Pleurochrysis_carterae.AAC.1
MLPTNRHVAPVAPRRVATCAASAMAASTAATLGVSTGGAGARETGVVADAVRQARQASDEAFGAEAPNHQAPIDFSSLGLICWNRHGAHSLFRLAGGGLLFTGGRDVAHRLAAQDADDITVNVMRVGGGEPEAVAAGQLLALSNDALVPGVLTGKDQRRGAAAQGLRVEGVPAALIPLDRVAPPQ